jgi:DNA-binding response OmpR family regulator
MGPATAARDQESAAPLGAGSRAAPADSRAMAGPAPPPASPGAILVITADEPAAVALRRALAQEGLDVVTSTSAADAVALAYTCPAPVLIVLDLAPARRSAVAARAAGGPSAPVQSQAARWELLAHLRAATASPIITLGGRQELESITALELGADDHVRRPFNPAEVAARVRAILRRRAPPARSCRQSAHRDE